MPRTHSLSGSNKTRIPLANLGATSLAGQVLLEFLRNRSELTYLFFVAGSNRAVPVAVEIGWLEANVLELFVGDFLTGAIGAAVERGLDFESGRGRRAANELDDDVVVQLGVVLFQKF